MAELGDPSQPFHKLWEKTKQMGLVDCVCSACSMKMGAAEAAKEQGLTMCDEMMGHPSMLRYMEQGYTVVTL